MRRHHFGRGRFRPLVLCYHAVSDTWEHTLSVPPRAFEEQILRILRSGHAPLTAEQALLHSAKGFHVTFDDAFRSINGALDRLASLRVPATVFACSDYADEGRPLVVGDLEQTGEPRRELETMTWDELRSLAERGIEVGSHTVSHPHLPELSDVELDDELRRSKERLEDELRRPCPFLAYPFGSQNARVRAAARAAGYRAAFALPGRQSPIDWWAIPRVGVYGRDGARRAALKMSLPGRYATSILRAGRPGRRHDDPPDAT